MRYTLTNARSTPVEVELVQGGLDQGYWLDTRAVSGTVPGQQVFRPRTGATSSPFRPTERLEIHLRSSKRVSDHAEAGRQKWEPVLRQDDAITKKWSGRRDSRIALAAPALAALLLLSAWPLRPGRAARSSSRPVRRLVSVTLYRDPLSLTRSTRAWSWNGLGGYALITESWTVEPARRRERGYASRASPAAYWPQKRDRSSAFRARSARRNCDARLLSPGYARRCRRSAAGSGSAAPTGDRRGHQTQAMIRLGPDGAVVLQTPRGSRPCAHRPARHPRLSMSAGGPVEKPTFAVPPRAGPPPGHHHLLLSGRGFDWRADYVAQVSPAGRTSTCSPGSPSPTAMTGLRGRRHPGGGGLGSTARTQDDEAPSVYADLKAELLARRRPATFRNSAAAAAAWQFSLSTARASSTRYPHSPPEPRRSSVQVNGPPAGGARRPQALPDSRAGHRRGQSQKQVALLSGAPGSRSSGSTSPLSNYLGSEDGGRERRSPRPSCSGPGTVARPRGLGLPLPARAG